MTDYRRAKGIVSQLVIGELKRIRETVKDLKNQLIELRNEVKEIRNGELEKCDSVGDNPERDSDDS